MTKARKRQKDTHPEKSFEKSFEKSNFLKTQQHDTLISAVDLIIKKTNDNNGCLPEGTLKDIISDLSEMGIITNQDELFKLKEKQEAKWSNKKEEKCTLPDSVVQKDCVTS
jgi:hypothetical protein